MKNIYLKFLAFLLIVAGVSSCQHNNDSEPPLPSEQISLNLLIDGTADPELLIGEWNAIKLAYTADGKKFSNEVAVQATLKIPSAPTPIDYEEKDLWRLSYYGSQYTCSLSGNLIELTLRRSHFYWIEPPHEAYDLTCALAGAYSFVIRGEELIIYFKGCENNVNQVNKNKNLLILKKTISHEKDISSGWLFKHNLPVVRQ